MLTLNNNALESFNRSKDNIDVTNMTSIREMVYHYDKLFDLSKLSVSEATGMVILKKTILHTIDESFDYRSDKFEESIIGLSETLNNIPRCYITEPLFALCEKSVGVVGNNKLITKSHNPNDSSRYPVDFVLYKMYSEGFISHRDMTTYKVSLETEVYELADRLELVDDKRVDDNTVPEQPQCRNTEVIHPNFNIINNLYEDYVKYSIDNEIDEEREFFNRYTCSTGAIMDKIYLCDIDFNGVTGIDLHDPVQVKKCQQVYQIMYAVQRYLEKLVLDETNNDEIVSNLHRLVMKFVTLLEAMPSVTAATLAKLVFCCLIDSTHLPEVTQPPVGKKTLSRLRDRVDKVCRDVMSEKSRFIPTALLNFNRLHYTISNDLSFSDLISSECVNECMELPSSPSSELYMENVKSASLEAYETSMSSLAEMFQVLSDGTIKVSLQEKTTYMNEYAMNHRLLVYNNQQKDYEAMSYNIVYHMILIDSIEKNVLYDRKVDKNSDLYKDAEQARRMAKSDIAQYLPVVRNNLPGFNLNKMYKQVKADKATITIQGAETAAGIKTILKHILY